jgi:glutathione reductase (NADPH)
MAHYDLFVIGGGSGGVACARRSAGYGAKVGLAEMSRVGGTCVIRGCVPKKLMHYGAHFAEAFHHAKGYGWRFGAEPVLDFRALLEARNREIQRLNGIYLGMLERAGVVLHPGRAKLLERDGRGRFVIGVDHEAHTADKVLVAVGASPARPAILGIEHSLTSDEVLEEVYDLPGRLTVVGAGYIGIELAGIMNSWVRRRGSSCGPTCRFAASTRTCAAI